MPEATRRRWYVEDAPAQRHLAAVHADAEGIRLDQPRWRDLRHVTGAVEGLVVGDGTRGADLAAALADLADRAEVPLLLPRDGMATVDWVTACAGWRLTGTPVEHADVLDVRVAPTGTGPTLATLAALHLRGPRPRVHAPTPWRTALVDEVAHAWFGDLASRWPRASCTVAALGADVPARAVVEDTGAPPRRLRIATDPTGATEDADLVVTDDPLLARDGVQVVARPVDLRRHSPVGCSPRAASGPSVLPISADGRPAGVTRARELAARVAEELAAAGAVDGDRVLELGLPTDGVPTPVGLAGLREATVLLDHPDVHAGPGPHARWLVACVAAGVPVLLLDDLPTPVAGLLGPGLADALAAATVDDVADPDLRERTSVLQRRQVLAAHTSTARLRQLAGDLALLAPRLRTVSVVMATNRERFLEHACRQIARQDWPELEVVLVTHGDAAPAGVTGLVGELLGDRPTTIRHVTDRWTLGDALNVGVEVAGGDVVTKFDDDDWYSPSHVTEMVDALAYAGADIVGRGAEFVHLAASATTVRRWGQGGERPGTTLAGGTLTFRRDVWRDVAGFPRVSVGEDRGLIEDVLAAGGTTYRCHPFGYLLHRHGQHAWDVEDQAFLDAAVASRPGPDHDWTLT